MIAAFAHAAYPAAHVIVVVRDTAYRERSAAFNAATISEQPIRLRPCGRLVYVVSRPAQFSSASFPSKFVVKG